MHFLYDFQPFRPKILNAAVSYWFVGTEGTRGVLTTYAHFCLLHSGAVLLAFDFIPMWRGSQLT